MSLVTAYDLSLSFSGRELFNRIGFQVENGDHIGLVGPNGSGKTSLMRLLADQITPDSGEIRKARNILIGYLPQDIQDRLSGNTLDSVLNSIPGRESAMAEILKLENSLKDNSEKRDLEALASRLAELHQKISTLETQYPSHSAEKILEGLGFRTEDLDKPASNLSGGWKMRAALGSLLYRNPDLLLLDEPTNHLDIPSVRWLEQFLHDFQGAIILVCHDRDFLNRQVSRLFSFEPEGMRTYNGNYDEYLKAREDESRTLEAKARNQEIKVKEAKKFIERFRVKATKARQAQSKIKLLEKMELVKSHRQNRTINFSFPEVARSGSTTVLIHGISKRYGENILYKDLNLSLTRGERVAVIGQNGTGKTTLLRIITGEIKADKGNISLGHNVEMSYYAQHHSDMLDNNKTILEEVYQVVPHEKVSYVRGICGAFLFSGDDVEKPVKVLSGGEKARVCLAKILIKPGNLMIMDEPTNHLDLASSEILIDALADYNGSLLFVSHNQSFINRLATKIWDIRDGEIHEYPGTLYEYYDFLARNEKGMENSPSPCREAEEENRPEPDKGGGSKKDIRKEKAARRRIIDSRLKPIRERLRKQEERISCLEQKEKEIGTALADPETFKDKEKSLPLLDEYGRIKKELDELLVSWEKSQNEMETVSMELEG